MTNKPLKVLGATFTHTNDKKPNMKPQSAKTSTHSLMFIELLEDLMLEQREQA